MGELSATARGQGKMMQLNITLYSDIACPWCFIGMHRLNRVIERDFPGISFDITHRPVILMPDLPPSGMRMDDYISRKYGLTDPAQAWASAEAEAKKSGIDFDHRRLKYAYRTDRAHALIRLAHACGQQHALAGALYDAYLVKNVNISDPGTLASIAEPFGLTKKETENVVLDADEVRRIQELADNAAAEGVKSIPHYVFGADNQINGNVSEPAIRQQIQNALSAVDQAT